MTPQLVRLLARKAGMTQVFDERGNLVPVTALRVDPNVVVALRGEGENASVTLGVDEMKARKVKKPYAGQFAAGAAGSGEAAEGAENGGEAGAKALTPKRHLREFRNFGKKCEVGETLGVELFEGVRYVDVSGVSKGKGMQGVVRRWGFGGGRATHGSKFHREPGGTGQSTYPGKTFKNVKLPGRMGRERVTTLSLRVVKVDAGTQTILVNGAVPGVKKGLVILRPAVKKQRV